MLSNANIALVVGRRLNLCTAAALTSPLQSTRSMRPKSFLYIWTVFWSTIQKKIHGPKWDGVLPLHGQCLNTGSSRKNAYLYVIAEKGLATEAIWRPACDHLSCRHLGEMPVARARTN